jgi:hypothetical protein
MIRLAATLALLLALLAPEPSRAAADPPQDPIVAALQSSFEYGQYAAVLEKAQIRIDEGHLSDQDLLQLHRLAGLSAFNLQRSDDAERHFTALLRLSPDFSLDPFVVPPPAIKYFEELKGRLAPELDRIRQSRKLAEQTRQDAEARAQAARVEEERRRMEALASRVTVRTVEKRSFWVNFVPFGAGQFQQGREVPAVAFAVSEGVLAATSVLSYFAYGALFEERTLPGAPGAVESGIPLNRQIEARNWRLLKIGSAIGFYVLWAGGVADAVYHHRDEVVTVTRVSEPALPGGPSSAAPSLTPSSLAPASTVSLAPQADLWFDAHGGGASLTLRF